MLRYIYLLCLIISFELVFCYNYIDNQPSRRCNRRGVRGYDRNNLEVRHRKRPKYVLEDRPMAQIDVASFIQEPDELESSKSFGYDVEKRQPFGEPQKASEVASRPARRYQHLHDKDDGSVGSYQHQQLLDRHLVKSLKKKSALTKLFPFFSHNKSDPDDKKETKGLFHQETVPDLNCSLSDHDESSFKTEKKAKSPLKTKQKIHEGIEKRYAEVLCPKCKLKLLKMKKKRRNATNLLHNSRQYFASLSNLKGSVRAGYKQFKNDNYKKQCAKTNENKNTVVRRKKRKVKKDTLD